MARQRLDRERRLRQRRVAEDLVEAQQQAGDQLVGARGEQAGAVLLGTAMLVGDAAAEIRDQLPIPRHWPLDGGRYAGTADAVITRDPDSGYLNIGTYRMMLQGKAQVGLYLSPGKDARLHITRAWQQGKPIEVAAARASGTGSATR